MSRRKFLFKPYRPMMMPLRNGHRYEILFTLGLMWYLNNKLNSTFVNSFKELGKQDWEKI